MATLYSTPAGMASNVHAPALAGTPGRARRTIVAERSLDLVAKLSVLWKKPRTWSWSHQLAPEVEVVRVRHRQVQAGVIDVVGQLVGESWSLDARKACAERRAMKAELRYCAAALPQ